MQLVYRVVMQWCVTLLLYNMALYSKSLNPTLRISRCSSAGNAFLDCNPEVGDSSPLCTTIFLPTMFACWQLYVFTGEDPQSKWLKRDESNRVQDVSENMQQLLISSKIGCKPGRIKVIYQIQAYNLTILLIIKKSWNRYKIGPLWRHKLNPNNSDTFPFLWYWILQYNT